MERSIPFLLNWKTNNYGRVFGISQSDKYMNLLFNILSMLISIFKHSGITLYLIDKSQVIWLLFCKETL